MAILAIGRKKRPFVASETCRYRAAILFSPIASYEASHVEPFAHLRDMFSRSRWPNPDTSMRCCLIAGSRSIGSAAGILLSYDVANGQFASSVSEPVRQHGPPEHAVARTVIHDPIVAGYGDQRPAVRSDFDRWLRPWKCSKRRLHHGM